MKEFIELPKSTTDLAGRRFGKLVVLGPTERRTMGKFASIIWLCRCDCGGTSEAQSGHLKSGRHASCGCTRSQKLGDTARTHAATGTAEWSVWRGMKQRCHNPKCKAYPRYGGRGIRVCDRWRDSFENFLADMGKRPGPEFELDRENNDLGYGPDNCRWVIRLVNIRNSRIPVRLTANGVTRLAVEWAEDLGISARTLCKRVRDGWTIEDAVSVPKRHVGETNRRGATHYSKRNASHPATAPINSTISLVDQNVRSA